MKKIILLFFNTALCIFNCAFSQSPLVKMWDNSYGGIAGDHVFSFMQTADGSYILGGPSYSIISGDKTEDTWGWGDFWIVKIDSMGVKQWDKDFGGLDLEELYTIQQTKDGGYVLGGMSTSGIGGNKTQPSHDTVPPLTWDYWIVKIDSSGNLQWEKSFGGTDHDVLYEVLQTSDGGYILGGTSSSGIGGDKTQPLWSTGSDYWVVKTDSMGNKLWDRDYGGTGTDALNSMIITSDGGFLLAGWSTSGANGDKSQVSWGNADYWILKVDSLGNKLWDNDIGGTEGDYDVFSVQQTFDKGFIIGGSSISDIGGDKTEMNWDPVLINNTWDYWIVKTDSLGKMLWDKDYGGTSNDHLNSIVQTADSGFILAGRSVSNIGGNKTESNLGYSQGWIIKTDSIGTLEWDKTIFTSPEPNAGLSAHAIQTRDGCYAVAKCSYGDVAGYKTQLNHDLSHSSGDLWIVKFCEGTQAAFTSPSFICPGSCIDFTNLSVNAITSQWSFPGSNQSTSTDVNPMGICYTNPGSYDVQLIVTNLYGSDTLLMANYITVYPSPQGQSITQNGDTLYAIAGAGFYQWYLNGTVINGATDYYCAITSDGDYNVVVTDTNGCQVEAVINDVIAGLNQFPVSSSQLVIFPNPVNDKFTIQKTEVTNGTAAEISIYNVMGEEVLKQESRDKNQKVVVDVSMLPPGIYFLEMFTQEKSLRTKFLKQ